MWEGAVAPQESAISEVVVPQENASCPAKLSNLVVILIKKGVLIGDIVTDTIVIFGAEV